MEDKTVNDRIRRLRKYLKLSQEQFSEYLGITRAGVSDIEGGRRHVTDQHIKMLTLQSMYGYRVSEDWLRTGEGDMFLQLNTKEQIQQFLTCSLNEPDESIKNKIISALAGLSEEDWGVVEKLVDNLEERVKEREKNK